MKQFIVQRAATGEVLTYDAAGLTAGPRTEQLSAVGALTLTMDLSALPPVAADGRPLLQEWSSIVTLQEDGALRFRGIVVRISGSTAELASVATYPHGIPYTGPAYRVGGVDAADIFRMVWQHAQSFPDSDLGVTVVGTTPVRLGTESTARKENAVAAYDDAVRRYKDESAELKRLREIVARSRKAYSALVDDRTAKQQVLTAAKAKKPKDQPAIDAAQAAVNAADNAKATQNAIIAGQQGDVDKQAGVVATVKKAKDAAYATKQAATKQEKDDGGAYTLLPWEAPDCGQTLDELVKTAGFDWREELYWDGDVPATRIRIAYPRLGRRLSGDGDPIFQQGVNITSPIVPEADGDSFANAVYGVGAGEGSGAVRRTIEQRDGRLRRVAAFQAKDVKSAASMDARLQVELAARLQPLEVKQITVADHPNSPRGSYTLGDDIYVQGNDPHHGPINLWHRIVGITENTDGTTTVQLERSDTFTYGRGLTE